MIAGLKRLRGRLVGRQRNRRRDRIAAYAEAYAQRNGLDELIARANADSASTGTGMLDYVLLHELVRSRRPRHVLECGTGRSTWVIAHALAQNKRDHGVDGRVTSMESEQVWFDEAVKIFPGELGPFADIRCSEQTTYQHSFILGTCYAAVPELPYELVFVDGPSVKIPNGTGTHETVNLDFLKVVLRSTAPVTAVVDYRLRTVIAYGLLFGRRRVEFLRPWNVGVVENVTKDDVLLGDEVVRAKQTILDDAARVKKILADAAVCRESEPSWIDLAR